MVAKGKAQTTAATYRYGAGLVHEVTVYFALILQSNIPSKWVLFHKYLSSVFSLKSPKWLLSPQRVNSIISVCQGLIRISVAVPKQTHSRSTALTDTYLSLTPGRQILAGGM